MRRKKPDYKPKRLSARNMDLPYGICGIFMQIQGNALVLLLKLD